MTKRFLVFDDYATQIQQEDLFQIIENKSNWVNGCCFDETTQDLLKNAELIAQEEISSYIRNRYIVDEIFAPTQNWASGTTFFGKNLVVYTEPKYSTGTTYNLGDRFSYKHNIYETISGGTSGNTNPSTATTVFNFIARNEQFYFANLPVPEFNPNIDYIIGNLVWYQDHIYQAVQNIKGKTPAQSQNLELRYGIPSAQGYLGIYSDINSSLPPIVPKINSNYWALYNGPVNNNFTGSTYYFSGITPDNTTYWTLGDNRNPQIKMYMIDIILYHLLARINPRNIGELRNIRYNGNNSYETGGAIGWLKNIEKGRINLDCPEIQPTQGLDIRFGSYPKNSNFF